MIIFYAGSIGYIVLEFESANITPARVIGAVYRPGLVALILNQRAATPVDTCRYMIYDWAA